MSRVPIFSEVVDAADALSEEEREELVRILQGRLLDERRRRLREQCEAGMAEYRQGQATPMGVDEILRRSEP